VNASSALRIDVFSVFPELVDGALSTSIIGRARNNGHIDLRLHDPRQTCWPHRFAPPSRPGRSLR